MSEVERWRAIACYLAQCHAGTAEYECELKSVSRARKDRFVSICQKAMWLLDGSDSAVAHSLDPQRTIDRLAGVVARHKDH